MADANQLKPGSPSRTTGAPIGSVHGGGDGSRAVEDTKEMGTELIGAVREGATSFFEEQRNRAASEIAALGDMLRRSARSLGMMADDVESFARQWPVAFIAAAVGAGFLAGRFLKASGRQRYQRRGVPSSRTSASIPSRASSSLDTERHALLPGESTVDATRTGL
jgi:hypothetical protein